jgi:hypothetical protein
MIFFLIILIVSFSATTTLLMRRSVRLKGITRDELLERIAATRPFWMDFYEMFFVPAWHVYQEEVRPFIFKEIEILARRFRIIVLRVECLLLRFAEYIRGKRVISSNSHKPARNAGRSTAGRSHYWEQLNNCKNGAHKPGDNL